MVSYKSKYTQSYIDKSNVGTSYDEKINNKFESMIWEVEKKLLRKIIKKKQKKQIYMDFACGTGRVINFIGKNFKNSIGVDTAKGMIKIAEDKNKSNSEFICGNIIEDKDLLKNKRFDVITSFRLFLNIEDKNRELILKELYKYLNDDGILVINNHVNRYSIIGFQFWIRNLIKPRHLRNNKNRIINTASEYEFRKLLNNSGFKVKKVYRFILLPGRKKVILLPKKYLIKFEYMISSIPLLNLFAKDQIYVCNKK
jgi:ubiquinone/menaquinone biosynthesis C-methylase UbiE